MKRKIVLALAFCALGGCAFEVEAPLGGEGGEEQPSTSEHAAALGGVSMGCYIDTSAYDSYSDGYCFRMGNQPSVASFRLFTPAPPSSVIWFDHPECTDVVCDVPIWPGETIVMGAYYIYQGTPTQGADAVAEYEYGYCPGC